MDYGTEPTRIRIMNCQFMSWVSPLFDDREYASLGISKRMQNRERKTENGEDSSLDALNRLSVTIVALCTVLVTRT